MTKVTNKNPLISGNTILQTGMWAQPKSVIRTDTFHGAGRQVASLVFMPSISFSHVLALTMTMTLYRHIFSQRRISLKAWWDGRLLGLPKCGMASQGSIFQPPWGLTCKHNWLDLSGSVPLALKKVLCREYIVCYQHLHDCHTKAVCL